MSEAVDRLIRALVRNALDDLLVSLDEAVGLGHFPTVEITRANGGITAVLVVRRMADQPPAIAGKIRDAQEAADIRAAHRRVLDKIPVGRENRVKAATVLRQLFPDINSYNRNLVTQLVRAGLVERDGEDGKVYRPA